MTRPTGGGGGMIVPLTANPSLDHRLALAVALGSAPARLPGTTIPHPRQVRPDLVRVTGLDLPVHDQPTPAIAPPREGEPMPTKSAVVGSAVGLHARPAALIAEAAGELDSEVLIGVPGGDPVDASSALMIMTLGAGKGDTVEVTGDDQADVDHIAAMVEQDLDA